MKGQKFDLVEVALKGETFDYNVEYSKIHKMNLDALESIAVIQEVDTSNFVTPEEFADHFNELQKVSSLASAADTQLNGLNDVYLAELMGRRKALMEQLEITLLSDSSAKYSMFSVQMFIVALFFGFIAIGFYYGLNDSSYRYVIGIMGFIVFMAFTRRKLAPLAPGIQSQIDHLNEAIKEFAETAQMRREVKAKHRESGLR